MLVSTREEKKFFCQQVDSTATLTVCLANLKLCGYWMMNVKREHPGRFSLAFAAMLPTAVHGNIQIANETDYQIARWD